MKTQNKKPELAVFNTALATRNLISPVPCGQMVCRPSATVRTGVISPGFDRVERRVQAREQRRLEWERKRKARKERERTSADID